MNNNTHKWEVIDNFEELKLSEIQAFAERANSFFSRNKDHYALGEHYIEIAGAINFMRALEYHFERYIHFDTKIVKSHDFENRESAMQQIKESSKYLFGLQNELVAYINRLGQFYYFATSKFVKDINPEALELIPKINELKVFRMKNTAHRSLDKPHGETHTMKLYQAYSLMGGPIYNQEGHLSFQMAEKVKPNGDWEPPVFITLVMDNRIILNQAYNLIVSLIK